MEIDKLKETLKEYADYAIKLVKENKRKDKEIDRLKRENKIFYELSKDYYEKIFKAIEYIKENQYRLDLDRIKNELLEILGDDNET